MKYLIVPLSKSPHQKGRIGPERIQDWYRGIVKAKQLLDQSEDSQILVLSAGKYAEEPEADAYLRGLKELGVDDQHILVDREGFETVTQIDTLKAMMRDLARVTPPSSPVQLVIISTFLHYLRVRWLCRGMKAKHYCAWGMPRPYEAFTDVLMIPAMIAIDTCGLRKWFVERVKSRRKTGKL